MTVTLPSEGYNLESVIGRGGPGESDIGIGEGGPALSAVLSAGVTTTFDGSGNMYIGDTANNRVRSVTPGGTMGTLAGTGEAGFAGDGGPADEALLSGPRGVLRVGNIVYICDANNHRIRAVNLTTGTMSTVAGDGSATASGDGGSALAAGVPNPYQIRQHSSGGLVIADRDGHHIRGFNPTAGPVTMYTIVIPAGQIATLAGSAAASSGFSGDGGAATSALLDSPQGVGLYANDDMLIADTKNNRVRLVVDATGVITTVVGDGTAGSAGDGGAASSAQVNDPNDVVIESGGDYYICETVADKIRKVTSGTISTYAGTGVDGFSGDGGAATSAQFSTPRALSLFNGGLFIGDESNNRIRVVNTTGAPVSYFGVSVAAANIDSVAGGGVLDNGDGKPGVLGILIRPWGTTVHPANDRVYASELNGRFIRELNLNTGLIRNFAGTGNSGGSGDGGPAGAANIDGPTQMVTTATHLYFVDRRNDAIRAIDFATETINTVAGTLGVSGLSGDGGPATAALIDGPWGIGENAGVVYFTSRSNQRVRAFNTTGSPVTVFGVTIAPGNIDTVAGNGVSGYAGDGGPALSANLDDPLAVAFDSAGNMFIGERDNFTVRRVDAVTAVITTVAGTGAVSGYTGDGGPATSATMNQVFGIAIDPNDNLIIADSPNHVLRGVNLGGAPATILGVSVAAGAIETVAGNGTGAFAGDGGNALSASFNETGGLYFDGNGNLYITDASNNRIRRMNVNGNLTVDRTSLNTPAGNAEFTFALPLARDADDIDLASVQLYAVTSTKGEVRVDAEPAELKLTPATGFDGTIDTNGDGNKDARILAFNRDTIASWAADVSTLGMRWRCKTTAGVWMSGDLTKTVRVSLL